ncbi:MAG TPA: class I SAM-dependent methyltransferase [Bacteroidia bacterium]|jgi:SAM-dependent methyltransferase|nr:class I SAM-dependent methyltransferase [Bacteroidia bacterium]
MEESYPQHTQCLISGSKDLKALKGYERHYLVKSYPIGFVFCSRIPSQKELLEHYAKYSRDEYYSPITRLRYQELLDEFEPFRKTNKILDIGCGTGFFLEEAKAKGWEVHGTEFTDNAVEICRNKGITMQTGSLKAENYSPEAFDVITSFEVLEHINNPLEEITNIHKIMRTGGLVYLTTPNFNAVERYLLKGNYNVIEYPEHLSYYTPKTLNYLFTNNGFKKKKIKTTGISFSRLKASFRTMRHVENNELLVSATSSDELMRERSQSNPLFRVAIQLINGLLNTFKIGNSLKGWFVKE